MKRTQRATCRWCLSLVLACAAGSGHAEPPVFEIEIRDHLFYPARITVPRGQKVKLIVTNSDPTPEEFESYELNREKVIMGKHRAIIFIGPLEPGEYPFFGEFHPKTAQGIMVAE
jgi:plastocyanin